jgi:hypothetical protein
LIGRCGRCRSDRDTDNAGRHQPPEARAASATEMRAMAKASAAEMRADAATAIAKVAAANTATAIPEMRANRAAAKMASADAATTAAIAEMRADRWLQRKRLRRHSDAHRQQRRGCDDRSNPLHDCFLSVPWWIGHRARSVDLRRNAIRRSDDRMCGRSHTNAA